MKLMKLMKTLSGNLQFETWPHRPTDPTDPPVRPHRPTGSRRPHSTNPPPLHRSSSSYSSWRSANWRREPRQLRFIVGNPPFNFVHARISEAREDESAVKRGQCRYNCKKFSVLIETCW